MNYNIITYCLYLLITASVILFVGSILFKNGRPFLINVFHGDITLADSINKLLLVGYYLVNIGYTVIALRVWEKIYVLKQLIEILTAKISLIIFILGFMHIFNVIVLLITERVITKKINKSLTLNQKP